jgi:hypothetical protein
LGEVQISFAVGRAAPDFNARAGRNAGIEHQPMPGTIGIATIERVGQQRRLRNISRPLLLLQRNPIFCKVVVSVRFGRHQRLSAKQAHRQVFRDRHQHDLFIAQAYPKGIGLISLRSYDVQAVGKPAPTIAMFGHKRDVVANQLEIFLSFVLDQIEDRFRRDFVGQQLGVAISIDTREALPWIVIKYQHRAVRQRLDRNRIDCRRVVLRQRETRRKRAAGSLPHLTSIGGLKLIVIN